MNALERRIGQRRGATRAPAQAPEWQGRLRLPHRNQDSPIYNLSSPNFGLDNGVHFKQCLIGNDECKYWHPELLSLAKFDLGY